MTLFASAIIRGDLADLPLGQPARAARPRPSRRPRPGRASASKPLGVVLDEVVVEHRAAALLVELDEHLAERLEQRLVAAEPDLAGTRRRAACRGRGAPSRDCGLSKCSSPASRSGLIATIRPPCFFAFSSRVSMRGAFVPGFWPAIRIRSACSMSSSETDALPMPIVCGERARGRLVAHVRAVRQVVRAERADEQLVDERGLVARARRRCRTRPRRATRAGRSSSCDDVEGAVPGHGPVVRVAGLEQHRVGDPPLLAEGVVVPRPPAPPRSARRRTRASRGASSPPPPPPSRRSRRTRQASAGSGSGSGHAQLMQSKPLTWLMSSKVRGGLPRAHLLLAHLQRVADRRPAGRVRARLR